MANVTNAAGTAANFIPKFTSATVVANSTINDVAGKVGIGVAAPASNLDVNGTIRLGGTVPIPGISVNAAGNVGVGITAPAAFKLDVNGILKMTGFNLSTAPTNGYVLTSDNVGNGTWKATVVSTGTANAISKFTGPNAIANSVINESAGGNIGIGTATPGQKLTVNGTIESTFGGIKFPDGSTQVTATTVGPAGPQGIPGPQGLQGIPGPAGAGIPGISESGGKIGIGLDPTRTPQEKLTLAPDSNLVTEMPTPSGVAVAASPISGGLPMDDYFFRVTASDSMGWTKASAQLVFNLADPDHGIRVSWNPVLGATKYRVHRSLTAAGAYKYIEVTNTYYDYISDADFTLAGSPPDETTAYINKLSAAGDSWALGGNVGIGTTNPTGKLHITPALSQYGIVIDANNYGEIYMAGATQGANIISEGDMYLLAGSGRALYFGSNGVNKQMSLANGSLEVATELKISAGNLANAGSGLRLGNDASGFKWIQSFDSRPLCLNPLGNPVGIAITTPQAALHVNGGAIVEGQMFAQSFQNNSSKRWKTNIRTIKGALSIVKRLRGISYNQKKDNKQTIGLVAEEVGEVIPEIVTYEENGKDAQGLDYSRLVAVLIEAVKEQQGQIEELKDTVKSLMVDKSRSVGLA